MKIRGYMAMSADGYIADSEGGVSWLDPFNSVDAGYDAFFAEIGTIVFGRLTYEQTLTFTGDWTFDKAYAGKRCIVVTSKPLADQAGVERWTAGVPALIETLKADPGEGGDAWVIGGAMLQSAFIDAGAMDRLDLFVIPVLLGDGVRAFPPTNAGVPLTLLSTEALGMGMVRLSYGLGARD